MKKINIFLFLIIVAIILPGCSASINYQYRNSNLYHIGEAQFNLADINKIVIDWVLGEVEIKGIANQTNIQISEEIDANTNEKYQMHYYLNNGTLNIKFMASMRQSNHKFLLKNLLVTLPEDFEKDLDINLISANTLIDNINSSVKVNLISGNLTLNNINSFSYDIKSVSGKINFTNVGITEAKIKAVSSNISVSQTVLAMITIDTISSLIDLDLLDKPLKCDIETTSGDIFLSLPNNSTFKFTFDHVNGKLNSEFPLIIKNSLYIVMAGGDTYHFKTVSGSLNLKIN